jgi:hypothetical protein
MPNKTISKQKDRINLIYIVSNGRSGSTLLEMLIGKHTQCMTVGEFQMLPIDFRNNIQPCGCGLSISNCEFWSKIYKINKSIIDNGSIDKFRDLSAGKVIRIKEIIDILLFRESDLKSQKKYGNENFKIFKNILKISNKDKKIKIIDSSKDPYRLKWLIQSGYFNINILHIIKSPNAFVYSMIKNEKSAIKKIYKTARMSVRWSLENLIIRTVSRTFAKKNRYYRVQYESLAKTPQVEMEKVFNFLKIENENITENGFQFKNHAISGNFMRFKSSKIKLDQKWIKYLGFVEKIIIYMITRPFKYLYKK